MQHASKNLKHIFLSLLLILFGVLSASLLFEGILRLKNLSMKNYEIEMWRYSKELKFRSPNPLLGHEHKRSASAVLQGQKIRLNEWGLRGAPLLDRSDGHRVILFLGSSITFGWGVAEEETLTSKVAQSFAKDGKTVEVLNGGIGNYNSERYVELFFNHLKQVNPSDIVVNYFLRDAEVLDLGRENWLLQNSQLAVTGWNILQHFKFSSSRATIDSHYQSLYRENHPGFQRMKTALSKLSTYCKQNKIRLFLAMVPDIHNLINYPFKEIHSQVGRVASDLGYEFIDLYPALKGIKAEEIWSLPDDPHPNATGHHKMAEAMYPILSRFQ